MRADPLSSSIQECREALARGEDVSGQRDDRYREWYGVEDIDDDMTALVVYDRNREHEGFRLRFRDFEVD
jgi:hypothetical protein